MDHIEHKNQESILMLELSRLLPTLEHSRWRVIWHPYSDVGYIDTPYFELKGDPALDSSSYNEEDPIARLIDLGNNEAYFIGKSREYVDRLIDVVNKKNDEINELKKLELKYSLAMEEIKELDAELKKAKLSTITTGTTTGTTASVNFKKYPPDWFRNTGNSLD